MNGKYAPPIAKLEDLYYNLVDVRDSTKRGTDSMARYSTGRTTKEKILKVSKDLFYEKGYHETSYNEICQKAEVNPGSIAYHFNGGKSGIAKCIYNEMMIYNQGKTLEMFPHEDNIVKMVISLGLHQKLFFQDPAYRRFSAEYSEECLSVMSVEDYKHLIPIVYDRISKEMDEMSANFYFAAISGMDNRIEPFIRENLDRLSYEQAVTLICELYLWFLEKNERDEKIKRALFLLKTVEVKNEEFNITVEKMGR